MKEFDFTQIKHYKLYNFIKAVFRPLVKLVFKAKFKGLENVPQDKGTKYIVAINHTSAIDPIIVACPKELKRELPLLLRLRAPMFFLLQFVAMVKLKPVSRLLFLTVNLSKTVSLGLTEKMLHRVILKRQLIW